MFNVGDRVRIVAAGSATEYIGLLCEVTDDPELLDFIENVRYYDGRTVTPLLPLEDRPGTFLTGENRRVSFVWDTDMLEKE